MARDIPHVEEKKKETKSRNREEIKAAEEKIGKKKRKKERDFNVNASNVIVKVRVISFNERG